jgi:exosortase/archaeosortase family protein
VLSFINVLRIATLVRIVEFYPGLFVYFHEYVCQGAFLMLVTLYALTWVEWARR